MDKVEGGKILPRSNPFRLTRSSLRCRLGAVSQNLLVLGRKLAVAAGFDFALPGKRRHLAQSFQRSLHFRSKWRIRLRGDPPPVSTISIGWCGPVTGQRRHHRVNGTNWWTRRKILRGSVVVVHVDRASLRGRPPGSRRPVRIGLRLGVRIRRRSRVVPIVILRRSVGIRSVVVVLPIVVVLSVVIVRPVVVIPAVVVVRGIRRIVPYVVFRRAVRRVGIVRIRVIRAVAVVAIRISPSPIRPAIAKSPAPTPASSAPTAAPASPTPAKAPATPSKITAATIESPSPKTAKRASTAKRARSAPSTKNSTAV